MIFKISTFRKPQYLYILLWVIYSFQGILYPVASIISQAALLAVLLMSVFYTFKVLSQREIASNGYIRSLVVLLVMFTIYGIILMISDRNLVIQSTGMHVNRSDYLKYIYVSLLPIMPFYYFTVNKCYDKKTLQKLVLLFVVVAIFQYFRIQRETLALVFERSGYEAGDITNNASYILLSLMPLLVLFRDKPILQYLLLTICMAFVISGFKRGAILIAVIACIIFIRDSLKYSNRKYRKYIYLLSIAFIIAGIYYWQYMLSSSDYFAARLEATREGDSSGRGDSYMFMLDYFWNSNGIFSMIFGNGAEYTLSINSANAHNDWLEILINQGIVGIIIYYSYFWNMFKQRNSRKNTFEVKMAINLILLIALFKSFFSMSYGGYTFYFALAIGYFVGKSHIPYYENE